jgi:hypothetical protein
MKIKIEKHFKKPINKNSTWLSNIKKRVQLRKNKIKFLTNNNLSFIQSIKIQPNSKLEITKELTQQQYNGLLYTNISKLR